MNFFICLRMHYIMHLVQVFTEKLPFFENVYICTVQMHGIQREKTSIAKILRNLSCQIEREKYTKNMAFTMKTTVMQIRQIAYKFFNERLASQRVSTSWAWQIRKLVEGEGEREKEQMKEASLITFRDIEVKRFLMPNNIRAVLLHSHTSSRQFSNFLFSFTF